MLNNKKENEKTNETDNWSNKWNIERNINESDIDQHSSFLYPKKRKKKLHKIALSLCNIYNDSSQRLTD